MHQEVGVDKFGYYAKLEKVTIHRIDILSLSKFMCRQDQKSYLTPHFQCRKSGNEIL